MRNCKPRTFYGTMWQYGDNTEIIIGTIGVFEPIPGMSNGDDVGFIFQNTQQLKCTKPGKYIVNWHICFNDGNNVTWGGGIMINDVIQNQTRGCRKLGAEDTGSMAGGGIVDLEENDILELGMANESTTANAFIDSAGLNLFRVDK